MRRSKTSSCSFAPSSCGQTRPPSSSSATSLPKCTNRTVLLGPTTGTVSSPSSTMYPTSGNPLSSSYILAALYAHTHTMPAPKPHYTRPTSLRPLPSTAIMPTPSWPMPPATVCLPTYSSRTSNLKFASHGAPPGVPVQLCPYITHSACRLAPRRKTRQVCSAAKVHAKAPLEQLWPPLPLRVQPRLQMRMCRDHEQHRATTHPAYRFPPRGSARNRETCRHAHTRRSSQHAYPPTTL